jgi:hypothetical protein
LALVVLEDFLFDWFLIRSTARSGLFQNASNRLPPLESLWELHVSPKLLKILVIRKQTALFRKKVVLAFRESFGNSPENEILEEAEESLSENQTGSSVEDPATPEDLETSQTRPVVRHYLGQGSSCQVHELMDPSTGERFASKTVREKPGSGTKEEQVAGLSNEETLMKRFQHPHLPSFLKKVDGALHFQPVAKCNLQDYLSRDCTNSDYRWHFRRRMLTWFGCLASTLKYLHGLQIRHNDLKPQNTLVDDESIWVIDFGTAIDTIVLGTPISRTRVRAVSPRYCAPEGGNSPILQATAG